MQNHTKDLQFWHSCLSSPFFNEESVIGRCVLSLRSVTGRCVFSYLVGKRRNSNTHFSGAVTHRCSGMDTCSNSSTVCVCECVCVCVCVCAGWVARAAGIIAICKQLTVIPLPLPLPPLSLSVSVSLSLSLSFPF